MVLREGLCEQATVSWGLQMRQSNTEALAWLEELESV